MKKRYFDTNTSLKELVFNLSSEIYSVLITDVENVYFEHKIRKDIIIKPIKVQISDGDLKSIYDHFTISNPNIKIENIEYEIYDYLVAIIHEDDETKQEKNDKPILINIINTSLTELMCLKEKSEFNEEDRNWSIFEYVSNTFEPEIVKEVEPMDLPIN